MKNIIHLLLLLLLFFSCGKSTSVPSPELVKAESLMLTDADSALSILSAMPVPTNKAQYATWCLLLTQAQDKNYIRHTSDSLIQIALHYFAKHADLRRQATALYYAGRVQDDLDNKVEATEYYVQAFDRAEQVKDYRLMALASNYLGRIYRQMGLKDRALEQQVLSYKSDSLAGDTIGVLYSLREIGTCYLHLGKLDSALLLYKNALNLSGQLGDTLAGALLNDIAVVYREQKQLDQSIVYFRKAIEKTTKQTNLYVTYFALGCAYLKLHQLDSANYYLLESTKRQNYYTKAGAYARLYGLEKLRGNYKLATVYNDLYLQYRDSVDNMELKKGVAEIESKYDYEKQQDAIKNLSFKKKRQANYYISLVLALVCAIMFVYILFQRRLRQKEKELQKHKEELQLRKKQLDDNEIQINENRRLITLNNNDIETTQQKNEILIQLNEQLQSARITDIKRIKQENEEKQYEYEKLIEQNKESIARNASEVLLKQQENEELMQENEDLRTDIIDKEALLAKGKVREHRIVEVNATKKYLIQIERNRIERSILQDPVLKPLLLCKQEKKAYTQNWDEVIFTIDSFYEGVIINLKQFLPSLSNDDILACSLLLIGFRNVEIACVTGSDVGAMHKRIERLAKKLQTPKGEDMITYLLGDLRMQMSINVDNR